MNQRYPSLDGLRGTAVLFVVFSHLSNEGLNLHPALNFSGAGKYGVFLFFVLSAFLLSCQFFQLPPDQLWDRNIWLRYAIRRILRIFPLYSLVLIGTALMNTVFHADFFWKDVGTHLILQGGKGIFWTIPVEFKYYILLPVVVFFLNGYLHGHIRIGVTIMFIALTGIAWQFPESQSEMNGIALLPYLVIFLPGTLAALIHIRLQTIPIRNRQGMEFIAGISFAAILITVPQLWNALTGDNIEPSHFHRSYFFYGLLWSVFILTHLNGTGFFRRFFSLKPLRMIGTVSFSMYLLHLPIILLAKKYVPLPSPLKIIVILSAIFLISLLSYTTIERPFIRLAECEKEKIKS
jgi:peptidoglycan/LPS O-acetylase OafA/YrhL